jgi:hypothetical protein
MLQRQETKLFTLNAFYIPEPCNVPLVLPSLVGEQSS